MLLPALHLIVHQRWWFPACTLLSCIWTNTGPCQLALDRSLPCAGLFASLIVAVLHVPIIYLMVFTLGACFSLPCILVDLTGIKPQAEATSVHDVTQIVEPMHSCSWTAPQHAEGINNGFHALQLSAFDLFGAIRPWVPGGGSCSISGLCPAAARLAGLDTLEQGESLARCLCLCLDSLPDLPDIDDGDRTPELCIY